MQYAAGYLALGNRTAADAQLELAFNHMSVPFNVFTEEAPWQSQPGTQHFITGSGGYLQVGSVMQRHLLPEVVTVLPRFTSVPSYITHLSGIRLWLRWHAHITAWRLVVRIARPSAAATRRHGS